MIAIGQVFTPLTWGQFAARSGPLIPWLSGKTVLDPTMGTGNLLAALVEAALEEGRALESLPLHNLFGIEIDASKRAEAIAFFQNSYRVDMSSQFLVGDLFEVGPMRCDLIFGNPPWMNFSDLPDELKPVYKTRFLKSGLAPQRSKLLLGGARIDLAALFVQKSISDFLVKGGEAWFFLPLSLFLNDAHRAFRLFAADGVRFRPLRGFDFRLEPVFAGVSTRAGLFAFRRDAAPEFPIPYEVFESGVWRSQLAAPAQGADDSWTVGQANDQSVGELPQIRLERRSRPRQGINTGGSNGVYFFHSYEKDGDRCLVNGEDYLPAEFVHPLLSSKQFREAEAAPEKWVLIPHDTQGKPLTAAAIEDHPLLRRYLEKHRPTLAARRGALIETLRNRGFWWAMLGVGPYNFASFKVVWEAAGRHRFVPQIWSGEWQVNQSLQCYIPCWAESDAARVLSQLQAPGVSECLSATSRAGTKSWAQPGSIRRLILWED